MNRAPRCCLRTSTCLRFCSFAADGGIVGVSAHAARRYHLEPFYLRIKDLIGHGKLGNVPIDRNASVAGFLAFLSAWRWARHCHSSCIHNSCHVLYGRQEREDHRVPQIRPILCQFTLAFLRLRGPLRILGSLGDDFGALIVHILQAVQLIAHGQADARQVIARSDLRLLAVMRDFLRASFQNALTHAAQLVILRERRLSRLLCSIVHNIWHGWNQVDLAGRHHVGHMLVALHEEAFLAGLGRADPRRGLALVHVLQQVTILK